MSRRGKVPVAMACRLVQVRKPPSEAIYMQRDENIAELPEDLGLSRDM